MEPAEDFLRLDDALQGADRFRGMNPAQRLDGFDAQVGAATSRQVAVSDGQQLADCLAIGSNPNLIDHQRHDQRIRVIEDLQQDVAPSRSATGGNLPHHAVLCGARKILHSTRQKYHDRFRIQPAEQPSHFPGFDDWPAADSASKILNGSFAQVGGQIGHMLRIVAQTAAIETRREMLHGGLRQQFQNIGQPCGYLPRLQRFLDKFRHAFFNPHLPAQAVRDARPLRLDAADEIERLLHRRETAAGGRRLAQPYKRRAHQSLRVRLSVEQDADAQGLVSAAFVRLSQAAATSRCFPAMEQALDLIGGVESQRPGIANSLRGKMGIEERVPEFVEEALKARQVATGLTNVLKLLPQTTMEHRATRFNRCSLRDDSEHVANLAADLGEGAVQYLRSTVRGGPIVEAGEMAGLLSRLDPEAVMVFLPGRMKDFPRAAQDRMVRQISASGAARRCHILLEILDYTDPLIMPLVIDEIGVAADREALGKLLTIADGDLPAGGGPYLRVKTIEALGRIHASESVSTLKRIVESKKVFGWLHPQELRIAALQALERLDPNWVHDCLPKCGIEDEDLALGPLEIPVTSRFVRQRRHMRVRLQKPVRAVSVNLKENCLLDIKTASLTGGVATISRHLAPGTQVQLKLQIGMRNLQATAIMRDYRAQDMAFEIVDMNLDERSKFRRLLAGNLPHAAVSADADVAAVPAAVVGSK